MRLNRHRTVPFWNLCTWAALGLLTPTIAWAQAEDDAPNDRGRARPKLQLSGEVKIGLRHSEELAFRLGTVVDPSFLRPGEAALFLRTPDAGTSLELANLAFTAHYQPTPHIAAHARVHALDLYNRNPTDTEDRLFVREAWVRFGDSTESLRPSAGSSVFAQLGLAPRFTKQLRRNFESYGLWGTAFGRLELMQLQVGGDLGRHLYWRAHVANRNPVFFRDPNALSGDNGTDRRVPGNNAPTFESGFPILYDTWAQDAGLNGKPEVGGGVGVKAVDDGGNGIDLLGWYFQGKLARSANLRGTFYSGDIGLLEGNDIPLGFSGNDKREVGTTLQARAGRLQLFSQYTDQEIANLGRRGFEVEVAYRLSLGGLVVSGDHPLFNWLALAFRFSNLDNSFAPPKGFVAPSVAWDWRKYDIGMRLGIMRDLDVTVEYARHDMITAARTLHPDELLVTFTAAIR